MTPRDLDFHARLEQHVGEWLATPESGDDTLRPLVALAPALFHLMCKLVADPDVPVAERARLGHAIAYFVIPMDIVPEALAGARGYVDDAALAAHALSFVAPPLLERHWAGAGTAREAVRLVLDRAESALGNPEIWAKLKALVL
jgi:uncharacterized membrane protein YkvA (DUF1232 family)